MEKQNLSTISMIKDVIDSIDGISFSHMDLTEAEAMDRKEEVIDNLKIVLNRLENKTYTIPYLYEAKQSFVDVCDEFGEKQHYSVLVKNMDDNDSVLSFEKISDNYPQWSFMMSESIEEYIDCIKNVDWIMNNIKENDFINEYLEERR